MNTKIKINKLLYKLDKNVISSKYDFFILSTVDDYIKGGSYILDASIFEDNIKSISFNTGKKLIVMMLKDEHNISKLHKILVEQEDGCKLSVSSCSIEEIPDYKIIQLLMNSLSNYDSDLHKFNNLTGHFYCFSPEWLERGEDKVTKKEIIWKVPCLEFYITSDYYLKMQIRTFSSVKLRNNISFEKKKFEDYPKYTFSKGNTMIRKLSGSSDQEFILRQEDGKKTRKKFLDIQNIIKFNNSKIGILEKIISSYNNQFKDCSFLEFDYVDIDNQINIKRTSKKNLYAIQKYLSNIGIHIIDYICDVDSQVFYKSISEYINNIYNISPSYGKRFKKDALNFGLIHNSDYYINNKLNDPYHTNNNLIQHITLEDFKLNSRVIKAELSSIINESLIKKDLIINKITLFDWPSLGFIDCISFGSQFIIDEIKRYFFMKVYPNGSFEISEQELNLFEENEYTDCFNIFEDSTENGEFINGVIRDSFGKINIIKHTGIITLPESAKIKGYLESGNTNLRNAEKKDELFSSILDIKTYKVNEKLYYFVGIIGEGMISSIANAANIRSIEGYNNAPLMFDKLLPTMTIPFVRNGQLTVVPFPFKYLREFVINTIQMKGVH